MFIILHAFVTDTFNEYLAHSTWCNRNFRNVLGNEKAAKLVSFYI